jgi:cytochrome c
MKLLKITVLCIIALGLIVSSAFAMKHLPEERGKTLFNDPKAFGGKTACSSCHPDGKGLEKAGAKKDWTTPAGKTKTLEEAINLCIVNANKGKALDVKSEQMKDMVAYIKSLEKKEAPKKPKAGGY